MRLVYLGLVSLLSWTGAALANGGGYSFGVTFTGAVAPFQAAGTEKVRILEEKLDVALRRGDAAVVVRYQMKNVTDQAATVKFGFPVEADPGGDDPPLKPNHEIREAFWSPLHHLADPERQAVKTFTYLEHAMALPTVRLLEDPRAPVLWGITYKFMDEFMSRIGRPIPFMPWADAD